MLSRTLIIAGMAVVLLAAGCGGGADNPSPAASPTSTVEAASPTPAPPTPTLPPPDESGYGLAPALMRATFDRMLGFSTFPGADNEGVVVTQAGVIWRVSLGDERPPEVFGDVSDRLIEEPGNEEGLLGLAFSPDFSADRAVYLYYTAGAPKRSVLSRFRVEDGAIDPSSEHVLLELEQRYANHNGGQLTFGPDGYLYLGLGDGGWVGDPDKNGQDLSTLYGSIIRLDVSGEEYAIPPDNPFVEVPDARPEIYAYGLRNPWRFTFDSATGDMWAGDVGQDKWEEVDRIVAGGNYGWNFLEGDSCYSSCDDSGLEPPRAVYGREDGCSVTGGYVYRGPSMPELDGYYIYGDFCTGKIWGVDTTDDSPPVLLADTGIPIASFGELPDGELLVITFANAIFRLERAP